MGNKLPKRITDNDKFFRFQYWSHTMLNNFTNKKEFIYFVKTKFKSVPIRYPLAQI